MANPRHLLGLAAEDAVARWLTDAGWTIVERRIRAGGGGEADIVGLDRSRVLVAVEVRARSTRRTGHAAESVDPARVARLGRTLTAVAARERLGSASLRIDLVTAEPEPGEIGRWRLRRIAGIGP
jgi:Holliday junction resolvase-like predicted endonuclease